MLGEWVPKIPSCRVACVVYSDGRQVLRVVDTPGDGRMLVTSYTLDISEN